MCAKTISGVVPFFGTKYDNWRCHSARNPTLEFGSNIFLPLCMFFNILDDGWPESVEEQGLLLLVLRHYITRQYIKDVL
jgi:hypothetical protein